MIRISLSPYLLVSLSTLLLGCEPSAKPVCTGYFSFKACRQSAHLRRRRSKNGWLGNFHLYLNKRVKDYARDVVNTAVDRPSRWSRYPLCPLKSNQVPSGECRFEQTLQPQLSG